MIVWNELNPQQQAALMQRPAQDANPQRAAEVLRLMEQIREANLSYLLLAKQLITEDKVEAMVRLGIDENTADLLDQMTTSQVLRIAANDMPMCQLRFEDAGIWKILSNQGREQTVSGMHAAILMAGRCAPVGA